MIDELIERMSDMAREGADDFMLRHGLKSCWVACDKGGDIWLYAVEPSHGRFWSCRGDAIRIARFAKPQDLDAVRIHAHEMITEISL